MKRLICAVLASSAMTGPAFADTLIVGNKTENTVSFIDLETGREAARRPTGKSPHEIAVSPDGRTAVVVSYRAGGYVGNTLHVFDVASAVKTGEISLGDHRAPHGLKWIPETGRVVVTTEASEDILVADIADGNVVDSVKTDQQGSHMVALSPDARRAFVANIGSGTFTAIDLETMTKIKDVEVGPGAEAIAVTPDGEEIWVGANEARTVSVFAADTLEKLREIKTEGVPIRIEISPDGAIAAVSEVDLNRVSLYDTRSRARLATVDLTDARAPVTLLFSPNGARLWVAATGSAKILEIDTDDWTIARAFDAGEGSDGLGYSPLDAAPAASE